MKLHRFKIKRTTKLPVAMVGGNTAVYMDGKKLRGVSKVSFEVEARGIAKITLEIVPGKLDLDDNIADVIGLVDLGLCDNHGGFPGVSTTECRKCMKGQTK